MKLATKHSAAKILRAGRCPGAVIIETPKGNRNKLKYDLAEDVQAV
jgi:hypothetical protein